MNIAKQIRENIGSRSQGAPFVSSELLSLGSREVVDQTLSRLVRGGELTRVARGVYVRPKKSRFVGAVMPSVYDVVQKLNQLTGHLVQVSGAEAARQFGLSTQVPTQSVFWTSGASRKFKMGEQLITLKHVAARKIALSGTKPGLAITAFWYLGAENVSINTIQTVISQLTTKEQETFKSALHNLPAWFSKIWYQYEKA